MMFNDTFLKNAKQALEPYDVQEIFSWARKNVILTAGTYADSGPFDVNKSRYLIEPFKAIKDLSIRKVICAGAVRTGKTLLIDVSMLWYIIHRPGAIQFTLETDNMVRDHINNRTYPLMKSCKPFKNIIPESDKDFTDTGLRFPHMTLYCNGAKPSAFQNKGVMFSINDEVHRWKDPNLLNMALARTSDFDIKGTGKALITSQPGIAGDAFDISYKEGTMEEWNVQCQSCSYYFYPIWREQRKDTSYYGMIWEDNETTRVSGSWIIPEVLKTVRYECKECGHKHIYSKELLEQWNKTGKYVQTNFTGDKKIRSFKWNAIIRYDWNDLVKQFIQATIEADAGIKGPNSSLTLFFQQKICQEYNPKQLNFHTHIKTDIYDTSEDWPEAIRRIMTIDVQKNSFWTIIREWSPEAKSRQLYFGQVNTSEELKQLQEKFKVDNNWIFVDVGNTETNEDGTQPVYDFVDKYSWTGLRGDHWHDDGWIYKVGNKEVRLYYSYPQPIPGKNNRWFYNFAPNTCRDLLKTLVDGKGPEFKILESTTYKKHMNAERRRWIRDKFGKGKWRWINENQLPNHAFDLETMQIVGTLLISSGIHLLEKEGDNNQSNPKQIRQNVES